MTGNTNLADMAPVTSRTKGHFLQIVLLSALVAALWSSVASAQGVRLDASMNAVAKDASDELDCEDCEADEDELLGLLDAGGKDRSRPEYSGMDGSGSDDGDGQSDDGFGVINIPGVTSPSSTMGSGAAAPPPPLVNAPPVVVPGIAL